MCVCVRVRAGGCQNASLRRCQRAAQFNLALEKIRPTDKEKKHRQPTQELAVDG